MNIARDHHHRIIYQFEWYTAFLIGWYTASSIRMGSSYQSDSMRHARDVCERICNRMLLHFHIVANMGFWFLVVTRQALLTRPKGRNASRDGLVKL